MTEEKPGVEPGQVTLDMFNELQLEVMHLKAEIARLRGIIDSPDSANEDTSPV